ncbi:VOC family protein [Sinomonas sp. ASV322]|uniref:VOC family protein n=1 Tax=Sinomonas sp. ASV322 TaxID=3041920 RepID=UPI0027DAE430|nr:VOC family protein [Sinomonas sp. ASV322]MDQ4503002.1 VOC family protein [Sinomonas sp. ASV322]
MLRVRPIITTPRVPEMRRLLEALGLVVTDGGADAHGPWLVLDAGHGRVALREAHEPRHSVAFAVEVRDPETFARRTVDDGGAAALVHDGDEPPFGAERTDAPWVRIEGPDGFSFRADPTTHGATSADADPRLTVRMAWLTPDVLGAAATLRAIGARPRDASGTVGEGAEFVAKNGGVLVVAAAEAAASGGLAFEYDGDLAPLADRLAATGARVSATSRGLTVSAPDGSSIAVIGVTHAATEPYAVEQ